MMVVRVVLGNVGDVGYRDVSYRCRGLARGEPSTKGELKS
jgi:hypothetical protein